ncbi:MAG: nuclear transport factor 2 family protein, partial [Paracoccaceae bacterium]
MSLYQKINAAQNNKDIEAYLDYLHEDFVFIRHQSGTKVNKSDWTPTLMSMMQSDALSFNNQRCLYENDEIMVEHSFMTFP